MLTDTISPLELIQEELHGEPWKLLVACMLLNQTCYKQVRPMINGFFDRYPTPESLVNASADDLIKLFKPLGFYNRRAQIVTRFAREWIDLCKTNNCMKLDRSLLLKLPGVGRYAADSYEIFVRNISHIQVTDKKLAAYLEWFNGKNDDSRS